MFRLLKNDLDLRLVYHKKDKSTMAHLHLGLLAYWVVNTIRYQLKKKETKPAETKENDIADKDGSIHCGWKEIVRGFGGASNAKIHQYDHSANQRGTEFSFTIVFR